jgi:hypothetical protein
MAIPYRVPLLSFPYDDACRNGMVSLACLAIVATFENSITRIFIMKATSPMSDAQSVVKICTQGNNNFSTFNVLNQRITTE